MKNIIFKLRKKNNAFSSQKEQKYTFKIKFLLNYVEICSFSRNMQKYAKYTFFYIWKKKVVKCEDIWKK